MAIDTFLFFEGIYSNVDAALEDYDAVKLMHTELGLSMRMTPRSSSTNKTARSR